VLTDEGVVDAADILGEEAITVRELLAGDRVGELRERVPASGAGAGKVPLDRTELLPPVPDPDKIICIGLNYRTHAEEAGPGEAEGAIAGFMLLNDLSARDLHS
jgi:2-keto-4-pentenoate hydratase/2-oxohepta-3-ene-1,7-dioic acid hydratase in catechol pathway